MPSIVQGTVTVNQLQVNGHHFTKAKIATLALLDHVTMQNSLLHDELSFVARFPIDIYCKLAKEKAKASGSPCVLPPYDILNQYSSSGYELSGVILYDKAMNALLLSWFVDASLTPSELVDALADRTRAQVLFEELSAKKDKPTNLIFVGLSELAPLLEELHSSTVIDSKLLEISLLCSLVRELPSSPLPSGPQRQSLSSSIQSESESEEWYRNTHLRALDLLSRRKAKWEVNQIWLRKKIAAFSGDWIETRTMLTDEVAKLLEITLNHEKHLISQYDTVCELYEQTPIVLI